MLPRPTLSGYDAHLATTEPGVAAGRGFSDAAHLPDCNQNTPLKALV
jgi:hypothetical protein